MKLIRRYETQAMAELRQLLNSKGHSNELIDHFKECLITLETEGFSLIKE